MRKVGFVRAGMTLLVVLLASAGTVDHGAAQEQEGRQAAAEKKEKRDLPLEPTRKIEFETDEGTWISLDVDPSGASLVFELVGDLYRLPMNGGTATRVTEGQGFDSQPAVSPDGKWIAFISDRDGADNVWIVAADGTQPRKLTKEKQDRIISPAWTPDSRYVIASKGGSRGGLFMYHVDGGSGIQLTKHADSPNEPRERQEVHQGATMSPDGDYLYFARRQAGSVYNAMFPIWQIARRDMRTGDVDVITRAEGSAIRPIVSPDGRMLVYGTRYETRTGLRVRDLETGADRWLVYPIQRDDQESASTRDLLPGYSFTPDGREVVVTWDGKIHRVDVASGLSREIPFTARVSVDVGPELGYQRQVEQGPVRARLVQDPRQAPGGSRVAFSVLAKVYVMDLPGGTPRRLTRSEDWEFKPAWSPDGRWIAYVTWSGDGTGHVWRTRSDGSGTPQRLTSVPAFYTDLTYSPDGSRIVALRGNAYMRQQTSSEFGGLRIPLDLVWMPAEGGDVTMIVPARGVGAPHFTAEADRIYVYSRGGLTSLRYDGTDRRTHLKVTGKPGRGSNEPAPAQTVLMRPDGRWALASVSNQLHVVAVPVVGGDAPTVNVFSPSVPAKQITDIGADYFAWADGGETITWSIGSTIFRRPFSSISFEPTEDEDEEREGATGQEAGDEEERKTPRDEEEGVESIEVVLEFPRSTPTGTIVLRGATVLTMAGGGVIENADVVVTDNRIAAVGPGGSVTIPAGAREMDVTGKFITPGFVDTHAHWEFRTHDVLEPLNWSLLANLAYGVTAGLDVQTSTNDYFAYQDLVDTGMSIGQRAFMTGPGVFSGNDFQSYEATLAYLTRYKRHYRTPNIKSYMVGNRKQRQWVVQASKELGLMPTTEGGLDLRLDMTHAIDGFHGNEHSLPIVPLYKDVVELFARSGTTYTPTLLVLYGGPWAENHFYQTMEVHDDPKLNRFTPHNEIDEKTRRRPQWFRHDEHSFQKTAAQAAKIQRAGGLVGVGAHGQLQGLGYHWEMWSFAMGGMTPAEVLKAATIDGARIIGVAEDLGSIETGKLADLLVLDRNPLEDIRNTNTIRWVMKNGELYEGDTLNQVWPVERPLPALWWWNDKPTDHTTQQQ